MTTADPQRRDVYVPAAIALVLFKVFVLGLAFGSGALLPGFFSESSYRGNFHWPPDQPPTLATRLETWDAQHYLYLATEGYGPGRWSIAFFPLYPWLIRAVAALPGIAPLAAALLVANALSLAAFLMLLRFLEERHPGAGQGALLLLLAFPGALFFHLPYTESLFLFLAVAVAAATASGRMPFAAAAAFLLALTRPNGVLIAAVLAHAAWSRWRRDRRIPAAHLLALASPFLGFGVYLAFMQSAAGGAFAGFAMQDAFHAGRSMASLVDLPHLARELADVRAFHGIDHSLLDRLAFLFALSTLVPLWRLDRSLFWYALPMALVGPLSGSLVSYTRFAAVLFPCHLVLARALNGERRRPWLWLTIAVFYGLQIVLLLRHVNFRWAG